MSQSAIRKAFEVKLATMSPALSTAYENVDFTPVAGTPYQRANLLPATPENPTLGDSHYLEIGLFQVTLCYPANTGSNTANSRAEAVRAFFPRGLSLTHSGVTLTVTRTPSVSPAFKDDDGRYCLAVSIQYHAHIN